LHKLNRRHAAGRRHASGKCPGRQRDGFGELLDRKVARDVVAHPFLGLGNPRVLARQIGDRHEWRLGAPFIEQEIVGAGFRQAWSREPADDRKHQVHLCHGRATGCDRPIGDDHLLRQQFDRGIALPEQRREPPCRGCPPAVEQASLRQQKCARAGRGEHGPGCVRPGQHVDRAPAHRALQLRAQFVRRRRSKTGDDDEFDSAQIDIASAGSATHRRNLEGRNALRSADPVGGCQYIVGDGRT
jgi:hypothetical protein